MQQLGWSLEEGLGVLPMTLAQAELAHQGLLELEQLEQPLVRVQLESKQQPQEH